MPSAGKVGSEIDKSSWVRKMFEEGIARKAKYGAENVFDLSIGNPNLEPPARFKEILRELIDESMPGLHAYMPNAGFLKTRKAVAEYLSKHNRQVFGPDDVVMTVGAAGALNVILKTILKPDDEVLIPSPYFGDYDLFIENHRGIPKAVMTKCDFSLDQKTIEEGITKKTKAVLINSPNNPTGNVYSEEELRDLGRLLCDYSKKKGQPIYLISDEVYRRIVYDNKRVPSVFDIYRESFVATSFSKNLSLPGERIGYAAVNPEISEKEGIMARMSLYNRVLGFVNAPALMQRAVPKLLEESVDISLYEKKRDILCEGLAECGYQFAKPAGAFYLFPKTPIEDDVAFVMALKEENILVVPGRAFSCPGYMRISYCVEDRTIKNALAGFKKVLKRFI